MGLQTYSETNVPVHLVLEWEAGIARDTRCQILHAASIPNWLYFSVTAEVLQPVSLSSRPAPSHALLPWRKGIAVVEMPLGAGAGSADICVRASSSNDCSSFLRALLLSLLTPGHLARFLFLKNFMSGNCPACIFLCPPFCDCLPPSFSTFPYSSNTWLHRWMASDVKIKNTMLFSFLQPNVSQHVVTEGSVWDRTSVSVRKAISVLSVNKWTEAYAELPGQVFWIRSLTWHLICWILQVTLYSFWDSLNIPSWWASIWSCH